MKFNKIASLTLASLLLLTGCSSTSGKTVDGKSVLASVQDTNIFADDIYNTIVTSTSGAQTLYQVILQEIFEKKNPVTDDMKTEADVMIKSVKQAYAGQEETLNTQLKGMGYSSLTDYKDAYMDYLQYTAFMNDYINEHFEDILNDYYTTSKPRMVSHILVKMADPENPTEEEQAKLTNAQNQLAEGKAFSDVAKELSDDGSASEGGNLGLCDTSTQFVTSFKEKMLELNEGEVSEPVKSEYGYHIIKVDSTNLETLRPELEKEDSVLKNWSSETFYDQYFEYVVYNSYNVQYDDETIKKAVTDYVNNALEQRESARKG